MIVKPLKNRLRDQYGAGVYLTNGQVDWGDPILFEPETDYCPDLAADFVSATHATQIDGLIDESIFSFGQGCTSLWNASPNELKIGEDYRGVFLLGIMLKKPNDRTYRIPRVLSPLVPELKRQADHHFSCSPHAIDKSVCLSLRSLPLVNGVRQISENSWHVHDVFTESLAKFAQNFYDITDGQLRMMGDISPKLLQSEYYVSNICPTMIQTAPFKKPVISRTTINDRVIRDVPEHRQLNDCEVVMGNGYVYHAASSVPAELVGQRRTFSLTTYLPSKGMERHFV